MYPTLLSLWQCPYPSKMLNSPVRVPSGAGAVVARDEKDQGIVELALVLDLLDHPPDLVVGVSHIGGEDVTCRTLSPTNEATAAHRREPISGRIAFQDLVAGPVWIIAASRADVGRDSTVAVETTTHHPPMHSSNAARSERPANPGLGLVNRHCDARC